LPQLFLWRHHLLPLFSSKATFLFGSHGIRLKRSLVGARLDDVTGDAENAIYARPRVTGLFEILFETFWKKILHIVIFVTRIKYINMHDSGWPDWTKIYFTHIIFVTQDTLCNKIDKMCRGTFLSTFFPNSSGHPGATPFSLGLFPAWTASWPPIHFRCQGRFGGSATVFGKFNSGIF
jgi:hypothetical protein